MATDRTITLAARDGKLFVLSEMPGYFEPTLGRSWYALGLRAADYEQFVGCALEIAPPEQRGKALETRWMNGRWEKLTARGWQLT